MTKIEIWMLKNLIFYRVLVLGFMDSLMAEWSRRRFCFKADGVSPRGQVLKILSQLTFVSPCVRLNRGGVSILDGLVMTRRRSPILSAHVASSKFSFKIYVFKSLVLLASLTYHRHHSFSFKPYFGEVLKKATWPPSPRVRPIRNWAPIVSWLKWCSQ